MNTATLDSRRALNLRPLSRPAREADQSRLAELNGKLASSGIHVRQYGHPARRMGVALYLGESSGVWETLRAAGIPHILSHVSGPGYTFDLSA